MGLARGAPVNSTLGGALPAKWPLQLKGGTRLAMHSETKFPGPISVHPQDGVIRHDWTRQEIVELFGLPFNDLLFRAHTVHRHYHDPNKIQISTLLSIKTGGCPEDCGYCPQAARYNTGIKNEPLMALADVVAAAKEAKAAGANRFCMGAAWRSPKDKDLAKVAEMIGAVKELGMETCVTLGMLKAEQAVGLKQAGLDYYNHNIDTSPEYYGEVVSTRRYHDRLATLEHARDAGLLICCGGIIGLGETVEDRAHLLQVLGNMQHPESVPINQLVKVEGTPMNEQESPEPLEFVRMICAARLVLPRSLIRLAAGRISMSESMQSLCFFAGANSIFYGDRLLATANSDASSDQKLLGKLGLSGSSLQ